ncbi:hypothetical protein NEIFL0001_2366 [Neisseria flavescens SK114]|nr:hypothetical protein NEIFL0001_2366 [Neisseria flavescens SK114]
MAGRRLLFSHILRLIPLFSGFIRKGRLKDFQTAFPFITF